MLPLLLNKIIQTDKLLFLHLVTQKNRIYTFLNPVSYLIALENKSLFEQFDGITEKFAVDGQVTYGIGLTFEFAVECQLHTSILFVSKE